MRVLYFTEKDSPHDRRFLKALAKTPYQVYALRWTPCFPETPQGITEVSWPGNFPDGSNWQGWQEGQRQLRNLLADIQPNLVHAGPVQRPALLAALTGFYPLVTMSWGSDLLLCSKRSPWMRLATEYTLEHTDLLLADCQTVADEAVRWGFSRDRIVQFPWGVDLDHFSPERAKRTGQALREVLDWEGKFVFLCTRSWEPIYGVDILAKAFVEAVSKNPRLRLILAGSGPQKDVINNILQPAEEKVWVPGWIDREKLPQLYGAADVFVSPSHSDGSSVSLMEALACGKPVLVSDIPSNQEWVKPGEAGDLFVDGNVSSLKTQLLRMAAEPTLAEYGKCARTLAEERADWRENFNKLLAAYDAAMSLKERCFSP